MPLKKIVILFLFFFCRRQPFKESKRHASRNRKLFEKSRCHQTYTKGKWPKLNSYITGTEGTRHLWWKRDCLSNYLCLSFEKLRDHSEDVASLLHATIDFISKYQPGKLLLPLLIENCFVCIIHISHIWDASLSSMNLLMHNLQVYRYHWCIVIFEFSLDENNYVEKFQ